MTGKILIISNNRTDAVTIGKIISQNGYGVTGIVNMLEEALAKLIDELPDLVVIDTENTPKTDFSNLIEKYDMPYMVISEIPKDQFFSGDFVPVAYVYKPKVELDLAKALEAFFSGDTKIKKKAKRTKAQDGVTSIEGLNIIGKSPLLLKALSLVEKVAKTDVTVLIEGETGVGKELIMKAIHLSSNRNKRALIKVNCAALPADLIESVLFGHEKGSFTGATEKRIGKFEQADKGTIFLDEIGDLPLISQSKLLRSLQEKEIETVGGSTQKKVDVRVIAATNKNLSDEVKEGLFRADLYYRLNVFPIHVPPLRERKEDIIPLANYFLEKSMARFHKTGLQFDPASIEAMQTYQWPGNIRELEHFVQRGALNATDTFVYIDIDLEALQLNDIAVSGSQRVKSLEETEREQILKVLRLCKGKIRGPKGAAEILKVHPNTLDFRIKKLGIIKENIFKKE